MPRRLPPDHRGPAAVAGLRQRRQQRGLPVSETIIHDCNGRPITVGAKIDGGNGVVGTVVQIHDPDESWGGVSVEWPEWPNDPEYFAAHPGRGLVPTCQEIEVIS